MFKKQYSLIVITLITIACFILSACKSSASKLNNNELTSYVKSQPLNKVNKANEALLTNKKKLQKKSTKENESNLIWARLNKNSNWNNCLDNKTVQHYIKKYKNQPFHFKQLSLQATPYLYHVVNELEKQQLPGELAVIPMIESVYNPNAISRAGACGLWQLARVTAKRYGVKQDKWYDGRRDVQDSTIAALKYLKFLYNEFNNDWLLALAAYNAGEGKVRQAIQKNKKLNKPITFWELPLPKQTLHFVPKILAMSHILKNAEKYDITLEPIQNKPFFTMVNTKSHMTLQAAANLASVSINILKKINAGYIKNSTHPVSPRKLYLPNNAISNFKLNLAKASKNNFENTIIHIVRSGDSLSKLAKKYNTSVPTIKLVNNLSNNLIIKDKELIIPLGTLHTASKT